MQVYLVGSKVWLKDMANSHRMGGKLDPVYTGPYTVTEILDKGHYRLQRADGTRLKKLYNGVLLKEKLDPVSSAEESTLPTKQYHQKGKNSNPACDERYAKIIIHAHVLSPILLSLIDAPWAEIEAGSSGLKR